MPNPLKSTKKALQTNPMEKEHSNTEGIELDKIQRRKSSGECLHCTWPSDRKGSHRVKDCKRPIKLDKETARYPTEKSYYQKTQLFYDSDRGETSGE